MSYEQLSGLGAAPRQLTFVPRSRGSQLRYPSRRGIVKRRTLQHEISLTLPRLPGHAVFPTQLSGLGFSLKPPKFIRKMQPGVILKKAAIPLAIAAAVLIPGALPLVAKGAMAVGRVALKGGAGIAKLAGKNISTAAGIIGIPKVSGGSVVSSIKKWFGSKKSASPPSLLPSDQPPPWVRSSPIPPASTPPPASTSPPTATPSPATSAEIPPPTYAPTSYGGGGGGGGGYSSPAAEIPTQAGLSASSLIPIGIGLVALVAISGTLRRHRR